MPQIQVWFISPYSLLLPVGDYPIGDRGELLRLSSVEAEKLDGDAEPYKIFLLIVDAPDAADADTISSLRRRYAARLLHHVNRLLRWYRVELRLPQETELTNAQASPFQFTHLQDGAIWAEELIYTPPLPPVRSDHSVDIARMEAKIRAALVDGSDPSISDVYLLDAELAYREERFRETVLNCWSVIDATFTTEFEKLAKQSLTGEWAEAREFFSTHEYSLKHRMSVGMYFVAGRSLFREPDNLWRDLAASYDKRNSIIHRGGTADEGDVLLALKVAQAVVRIMDEVTASANQSS